MFQHQGIWLPDGEKHFPQWMDSAGEIVDGRGTYQIKKWRACIPHIKNWRTAVDVGAHVGFWSIQMAKKFISVEAFEPMSVFRSCWIRNVIGIEDGSAYGSVRFDFGPSGIGGGHNLFFDLHDCALGDATGLVFMNYNQADSGNTHVEGNGDIEMRTLDSFGFENVDFIKIDCEGYEHHVIEGARETITRCKPCIIVEQKQHKMEQNYPGQSGTPAVDLLLGMGAKQRALISGDHILSFD